MNDLLDFVTKTINSDEFDGTVRHAISTLGGGLVSIGVATDAQVATIAGGVSVAVAVLWSWASKKFIKAQAAREAVVVQNVEIPNA